VRGNKVALPQILIREGKEMVTIKAMSRSQGEALIRYSLNNIDKRLRRIEKRLRSPVALLVPLTIYLLLKRRKLKKLRKEHEKALREEAGALRLVLTV